VTPPTTHSSAPLQPAARSWHANLPRMSSSVLWAAGIGVAGTVIVAWTGFASTRKSTDAVIRGERGHRLWDKRAATYESTIRALVQRQHERRAALRGGWVARETQERLQAVIDKYDPVRWLDAQATILAYATDEVLASVDASTEADRKVREANDRWKNLISQHQHGTPAQKEALVGRMQGARLDTEAALGECTAKDNVLIDLIRDELRAERYLPAKKDCTTDLMGGPDPGS
jgi:hypothetical protein